MPLGVAIAVDGTVDESLTSATWVEVHERLGEATTYRIRFEVNIGTDDLDRLVDERLDAGSTLSIFVDGSDGNSCLVKGQVGSQLIHLVDGGPGSYVEVTGGDRSIAMDREARSAVWSEVTDSDAITSIVARYGLTPDVESTPARHSENKHVLIQRESDLAFARRLARRNAHFFWITTNPLGIETAHFRRPAVDGKATAKLAINKTPSTLETLEVRWDVERPTSVEGIQLDLSTKQDLDAATDATGLSSLGSKALSEIATDKHSVFLVSPADDAGNLTARAKGALTDSNFFVRASGEVRLDSVGIPIRAHTVVEIEGAGSRHSGKYFVAGVRHTITQTEHRMELELLRNAWGG